MKYWFNFYDMILRSPDDGGAAGGAAAAAGAGDGAAASSSAAADAASTSSSGAADGAAGGAAASSAAAEIYKPDGLADHMLGKSNNETIDNLAKALNGYRERDAANKVPDKIEAYSDFGAEIAPEIAPHLDTLKADPLYGRMAQFALDQKIPLPVYQGMVKQFISASAEMGMLEPPVDEAKEKAELVPEASRNLPATEQTVAREKRMNENFAFVDAAVKGDPVKEGGIDKDTAEYVKAMLGDTARGHRFIEWVKTLAGGSSQQVFMGDTGAAGKDPKAEIARRQALPENTWGNRQFNQASYDALQADIRKTFGE